MPTDQNIRLRELIEFAQQSARLRSKPLAEVSRHGNFHEYEHNIVSLPGLHFDSAASGEDEVWLVVDRLHESAAPAPKSVLLKVWIDITNNPAKEPALRTHVEAKELLAIGAIAAEKDSDDTKRLVGFDAYPRRQEVEALLKSYSEIVWKPWAIEEKRRRRTISLYAKLFTLKQQLEGGIVDAQIELAWGAGVAVWNMSGSQVVYPLVTRLVELSLNELTMAIEVRPRDVDPRIEVDIFAAADNPGVSALEKAGKDFFAKTTTTFSPFDRGTFEHLLHTAVTYLDSKGVYWPSQTKVEDRTLPNATEELKVTDTWILFARPRSVSLFVQDLERFKKKLEDSGGKTVLPKAVEALVSDPATTNEDVLLPTFRGVSIVSGGSSAGTKEHPVQDLFFPMPFNDEQLRIVQLLEYFDGVVVQGPPGTGKTHTIANVICHYLALGKRVLVTSMKEPALSVLQEKLPDEIRPLAISLLTSEKEGMKQFEHAISKIAAEVQRIDRPTLSREISQSEGILDSYHAKLSMIDSQIRDWAIKNLSRINLDGQELEPQDAAVQVATNSRELDWFDDLISIDLTFNPRFTEADVARLREARHVLGKNIDYLDTNLPLIAAFPDSRELLQAHQDLSRSVELQAKVDKGEVPPLVNSTREAIELSENLFSQTSNLRLLKKSIEQVAATWTQPMLNRLRVGRQDDVLDLFEVLGAELGKALADRNPFLAKPVTVPNDIDQSSELIVGIQNMGQGKRPFGLTGLVSRGAERKALESVRIVNSSPEGPDEWLYVHKFVHHLKHQRELVTRWNMLADELQLPVFKVEPKNAVSAAGLFGHYEDLRKVAANENAIVTEIKKLLPTWGKAELIRNDESVLEEAGRILQHHVTRSRLAETWALKIRFQQVLSGCSGRIANEIRKFLDTKLGNPTVTDAAMQGKWTALMEDLRRIHDLKSQLKTIAEVCELIEDSGAPKWAARLRSVPAVAVSDTLLPGNWCEVWRLKRLMTYLNTIDCRDDLKRLAKLRSETATYLARTYKDVISKRTWLKLAENATADVRGALMAYMAAIAKIGKGTGKRAVRYRQDARSAALRANPAIPCWIMPHYRISESLPADFGCFELVVIDEASQSDLSALPAILRAKKILVVGDDKQVSPEGVGLEEEKVRSLMARYLSNQVETYRPQMSPERSIYDLFKVVFASSAVMLREHFRCVAPIIEYSKREFYNHELRPLRLPTFSERLDPSLIDVIVEDGFRKGDLNLSEARFILEEIKLIAQNPRMTKRSIGVVSLLGDKQALKIWEMLEVELGLELVQRHKITCGDARTFQGKERDIMFLSMVVSRGDATALSRDTFAQRFNVATSRARDRMYLVRSILPEELSDADRLRKSLIAHFSAPFTQDETIVDGLRSLCESPFEREVYDILTERGFRVVPQVPVGGYRIDMVVEGHQDKRLAIECDGDRYHGPDRWEDDMRRQRILERAGWHFWRCFASTFVLHRKEVIEDLLRALQDRAVDPIGADGAGHSIYAEQRRYTAFKEGQANADEESQPNLL